MHIYYQIDLGKRKRIIIIYAYQGIPISVYVFLSNDFVPRWDCTQAVWWGLDDLAEGVTYMWHSVGCPLWMNGKSFWK